MAKSTEYPHNKKQAAGKKRTGPNIVKNLPAKKGAKKTYKPY